MGVTPRLSDQGVTWCSLLKTSVKIWSRVRGADSLAISFGALSGDMDEMRKCI